MKLHKSLKQKIDFIKNSVPAQDIIYYQFSSDRGNFCAVYVDSLTEKAQVGELLLFPIYQANCKNVTEAKAKLQIANLIEVTDYHSLITELLKGRTALLCEGEDVALMCDFLFFMMRAVAEPPTSTVVKGPREGFNESMRTNLSMVRRRLRAPLFNVEMLEIGKQSKTAVALCYLANVVDKSLVAKVKKRLDGLIIDALPDSSYVGKFLATNKASLFKQVGNTEKPDVFCQKLLEGRVGIIVDGSPIAITLPYVIAEDFHNPEDYYMNHYRANIARFLRVISICFAVLLPAVFVAAQLFHLHVIPLNFLLTIVNSIKGIPLSPSFEMFFTLLIFEILNEASVRMPKYVGMALSIVGALVLGDTAVKAGIVSTPTIMIMALSGICLYTVPELVDSVSVLRLCFLVAAGTFGGYGVVVLSALLAIYLCNLENFGVPLLAPYAPCIQKDKKDGLYVDYLGNMQKRPLIFGSKNKTRMRIKKGE